MATIPAPTPNQLDIVLVGPNTSAIPPGLYVVLNPTAPYRIAPADQSGNPTTPIANTLAQSAIVAVYRAA